MADGWAGPSRRCRVAGPSPGGGCRDGGQWPQGMMGVLMVIMEACDAVSPWESFTVIVTE